MRVTILGLLCLNFGAAPPQNLQQPVLLRQTTPVGIAQMPGGSFAFYDRNQPERAVALSAPEGHLVTLEPSLALPPPDNRRPYHVLLDTEGELHEIFLQLRGEGRKPAVDRFLDLWHRKTTGRMAHWEEPSIVWQGYCGALMGYVQLRSGRIVVPFGSWIPGRTAAPPTGAHVVIVIYSDDGGKTWKHSDAQLKSPCYPGYNGANYGACEPSVVELGDGRLYMLMRTQAGFLYESWSADGAQWSPAAASRFHASHGPPNLLKLPDGRIVLFWNHCELPPRVDGEGVYGGRDALHAAISDDDGRTWQGFREIYRDPLRNETPPKDGDRGTAYPFGAYDKEGQIVVVSGQGVGRRNLIRFDPDWLTQRQEADDFSAGLDQWHTFKGFGPAKRWWRDRTTGPSLVDHPGKPGSKALHIRRLDDKSPDGAVWNFPIGRKGCLALRIMLQPGFAGGRIALADRFFEPCDDYGERLAMFCLPIAPDGRLGDGPVMRMGRWHSIELRWDLAAEICEVLLDGSPALKLTQAHTTGNGISYLRLRSSAAQADPAGMLVESASVVVEEPVAPPRTAEQNRQAEADYLRCYGLARQ